MGETLLSTTGEEVGLAYSFWPLTGERCRDFRRAKAMRNHKRATANSVEATTPDMFDVQGL